MSRRSGLLWAILIVALACAATTGGPALAFGADNTACLSCHETWQQFSVAPVDRDTACASCHTAGLIGTHPFHQPGANCAAYCHPGWGDSLLTAVPSHYDSAAGASFASPTSKDTPASVLHIIHSQARWPQGVDTDDSRCASCHAIAACAACHTGEVSASHDDHSSTQQAAWSETVAHGVVGGDQTIYSAQAEELMCATAGCHDIASSQANRPTARENFSHPAYPEYGLDEPNVVTYTPSTWAVRYDSRHTGGRMSYSNYAGATLSISFTGERVSVVADKDPYRGIAQVLIDGSLAGTVDLYAATTTYQATVFESGPLEPGSHTITVRSTGTKNPSSRYAYVTVDCFKVYSAVPPSIAPECTSCHPDKTVEHADFTHEATQTAGVYAGFACTECHTLAMFDEHSRPSSKTSQSLCGSCHTVYAPFEVDTYDSTCSWNAYGPGCHQAANGEQPHNFVDTDHDASGVAATAECRACHGDELSVIHDDSNASRLQHASLAGNAFAADCLLCHGADTFPLTKDCTSAGCHVASGVVDMASHPAPAHVGTNNNGVVPRTGGLVCSTCHVIELVSEHAKGSSATDPGGQPVECVDCHSAGYFPQGWMASPGVSNTCVACHDPAGAADAGAPHEAADYAAKHDWSATMTATCGSGSACHDASAIDAIHTDPLNGTVTVPRGGSCKSCHDTPGAVPAEDSCLDCHAGHDMAGAHDSNATPALAADNADCLACHVSYASLSAGHEGSGVACEACHDRTDPALADYVQDNYEARCTECHNDATLGDYDYQPYDPNHYDPYLTNHTATYTQTIVTGGTIVTSKPCTACHANSLSAEHAYTLSAGAVGCIGCHADSTLGSSAVVVADWPNDSCSDCHGATHGGTGMAVHDFTLCGAGCSGAGCHGHVDDLALLHADAVDAGDPAVTGCNVCHAGADTDLAAIDHCNDCHGPHDMTVHQTDASAECTDCHGQTDVRTVHPGGCNTCHGNPSYPALPGENTSECEDCHGDEVYDHTHDLDVAGSNYNGVAVTGCTNSGAGCHGSDTSANYQAYHPVSGCLSGPCHTSANQGDAAFDNPNTCQDCHSGGYANALDTVGLAENTPAGHYPAAIHTATSMTREADSAAQYTTAGDECADCHSAGMQVAHVDYGYGTDDVVCGECHNDTSVAGSGLSAQAQVLGNWTNDRCDDCHGTLNSGYHSTYNADHTATDGANTCAGTGNGCHSSTDLRSLHASLKGTATTFGCGVSGCHNTRDNRPAETNVSCGSGQACHTGYTNANHAGLTGNDPQHVASAASMATVVDGSPTYSFTCAGCHSGQLGTEHSTVLGGTLGHYGSDVVCIECHNSTSPVNALTQVQTDWPLKTCAACHGATRITGHTSSTGGVAGPHAIVACGNCHPPDAANIALYHDSVDAINGTLVSCSVCHINGADTNMIGVWGPITGGRSAGWDCQDCHPDGHRS